MPVFVSYFVYAAVLLEVVASRTIGSVSAVGCVCSLARILSLSTLGTTTLSIM